MIRHFAICSFFLFLLSFAVSGQTTGVFPKLYPASVAVYDIDRGMPITCLDNLFVDSTGRLFISPCRYQDIYQNLSFYYQNK